MSEKRIRATDGEGWAKVIGKSMLVLGISIAGFIVVPDILARQLSVSASPTIRDSAVLAWFAACTVGASWVLVRLQRTLDVEAVTVEITEDET